MEMICGICGVKVTGENPKHADRLMTEHNLKHKRSNEKGGRPRKAIWKTLNI